MHHDRKVTILGLATRALPVVFYTLIGVLGVYATKERITVLRWRDLALAGIVDGLNVDVLQMPICIALVP